MEAVAALPGVGRGAATATTEQPARILAQDPDEFIATMERWMMAYTDGMNDVVPGLTPAAAAACWTCRRWCCAAAESDFHHPRSTSEAVAAALPGPRSAEPPWGDREWRERQDERTGASPAGCSCGGRCWCRCSPTGRPPTLLLLWILRPRPTGDYPEFSWSWGQASFAAQPPSTGMMAPGDE